jgi:hypothetical protein
MSKITEKERSFCRYYTLTGNYREAAARAGYSNPEKAGVKLLSAKRITEALDEFKPGMPVSDDVIRGLKRLAFGSISDAVSLLFAEELPKDLESLDLFCVSEIKHPKSGGLEIKFFDRLKALEFLASVTTDTANTLAEPFYKALEKSAEGLFAANGGDDYGI